MYDKEKIIRIGAVITTIIVAFSLGAYIYFGHNKAKTELPIVAENTNQTTIVTAAPTVSTEPFAADAPADGIDVSSVKEKENPADTAAADEYQQQNSPILSEEDIAAADAEAKRTENALKNPQPKTDPKKGADEGVKVVPKTEPTATPSTQKADADGYFITKEQAIADGAVALQEAIDTQSYDWTYMHGEMKESGMSDKEITALIQKAKTDPYSSAALADYYDFYRKSCDKSILLGQILAWVYSGGSDTNYSGHGV